MDFHSDRAIVGAEESRQMEVPGPNHTSNKFEEDSQLNQWSGRYEVAFARQYLKEKFGF